jgi:hypothetical protein
MEKIFDYYDSSKISYDELLQFIASGMTFEQWNSRDQAD